MGWGKTFTICVSAVIATCCTTGLANPDGSPLPASTHADLVFVGKIVSSESIYLVNGDVVFDGNVRTFEALDQPGAKVSAIDPGLCPEGDLGDKALLVFLERKSTAKRRPKDREYYVYACTVVDADTRWRLRRYELCFGPDSTELNCFD